MRETAELPSVKTQMATEYIFRHLGNCDFAWWIKGLFPRKSESPGKHRFRRHPRAGLFGRAKETKRGPRHHLILVVDVEGFGERRRTRPDQEAVRAGLYKIMETAIAASGTAWGACYQEDRGDGMLVLVPGEVDKAAFVEAVLPKLVTQLRVHNDQHPETQQIRLRIALHAGEVGYDAYGVTSSSLTKTFRLCDASPLKDALAASPGVLAVIASDGLFDEVVRHIPGVAPATWRPVKVEVKEIDEPAWITLPDHPYLDRSE